MNPDNHLVQNKAKNAILRALKKEAEVLFHPRLKELAAIHGFNYRELQLRYLKSRWGSCSSKSDITLNTMLLTLPWELIDHVILHELLHTKVLKHGPEFWEEFERLAPGARKPSKRLKLLSTSL